MRATSSDSEPPHKGVTMSNDNALRRPVAEWYANMLGQLLLIGGVVFLLIAFRLGPMDVYVALGLGLALVWAVLFVSLLTRSELMYDFFSA